MTRTAVRRAGPEDALRISEIYGHYVRESTISFELEAPDAAEIRRRMSAVEELGLPYLVAECYGRVVGYAYAGRFRPRPAYRFSVEHSVYIDPEWTRRGIGLLLLRRLIEECARRGAQQMIAVIGGENPGSLALHERLGFRPVGVLRRVGRKFDQWLDATLMQLELGSDSCDPNGQT